jgi:hypothetical protein
VLYVRTIFITFYVVYMAHGEPCRDLVCAIRHHNIAVFQRGTRETLIAHPSLHRRWTPAPIRRLSRVSSLFSPVFAAEIQLTQDAVGRDRASTPGAVCPLRLNGELPLLAWAHVEQTLVPALDDLSSAYGEGQRLTTVV